MSQDELQVSRAGMGQVKSFMPQQVSCVTEKDGEYPMSMNLLNKS